VMLSLESWKLSTCDLDEGMGPRNIVTGVDFTPRSGVMGPLLKTGRGPTLRDLILLHSFNQHVFFSKLQ